MHNTILITGSSSGLGRELALELAQKENQIITHGRNISSLKSLQKQIEEKGGKNTFISGDLCSGSTITSLVEESKKAGIDILINNAGEYLNCELIKMDEKDIAHILEVNFLAPAKLIKGILPVFINKKKGLIININSIAGNFGSFGETAYCASKHALKGFSNSLKLEATTKGIKIIDVYLGAMATKMTLGRKEQELCINPKEAANAIANLCGDYESLYISEINILRRKYG